MEPDMSKTITSASFSKLMDFESCAFKAFLKHCERIPDPKPNPYAERGTVIHGKAEDFLNRKIKTLPDELMKFKDEFLALKKRDPSTLEMEQEWGFDREWNITPYKTAWLRMKADLIVHDSPVHALAVDYKTGKKFGNEIKHGEQLQVYALATFIRYPELQEITTELWYLDVDDLTSVKVTRERALERFLRVFDRRFRKMTDAKVFPPNPNIFSCKYCPYGHVTGTGDCKKQVVDAVATAKFYQRKNAGA